MPSLRRLKNYYMKTLTVSAVITAISLLASQAGASGFNIGSQDAGAGAMANAYTAVADNASATWYNPAATVFLEGGDNHYGIGAAFAFAHFRHTNTAGITDNTADEVPMIPAAYAVRKLNDKMALSLGVNAPFGFANKWHDSAATAAIATKSEVQDINFNLNFAYAFSEKFSAAIGYDYGYMSATLDSTMAQLDATKSEGGHGFNIALMYKPTTDWSFGAAYRSRISATLYGGRMKVPAMSLDRPLEAELTVPDMVTIGAAWKMNEKWLLSLQGDYTNWATYDRLNFVDRETGNLLSTQYKGFGPAYALRFGTKYAMNNKWTLRGGMLYDTNPVKASLLETRVPDSNRIGLSLGVTYNVSENMTIDLSYTREQFLERTVTGNKNNVVLDGEYRTYLNMPAISLGYKF